MGPETEFTLEEDWRSDHQVVTHAGEKLYNCTQWISFFAILAHLKQHMSLNTLTGTAFHLWLVQLSIMITIMDAQKHSSWHCYPATNLLGLCFTMITIVINKLAIVTTIITLCNQIRQPCTVADYYDHKYDHWWDWTTISTNNHNHNHDHNLYSGTTTLLGRWPWWRTSCAAPTRESRMLRVGFGFKNIFGFNSKISPVSNSKISLVSNSKLSLISTRDVNFPN